MSFYRLALAVIFGAISLPLPAFGQPTRPNIILIMTDDQGWGDVDYSQDLAPGDTFSGNPVLRTPNLESMAQAGLKFNRFYAASPVCSPTRASLLTGRHGRRSDINNPLFLNHDGKIRNRDITIAELAKTQGYTTGHFGKWHVGSLSKHTYDMRRGREGNYRHYSPPWNNGYDTTFASENWMPTYDPYDVFPHNNAEQAAYFTGSSDAALTNRVPNDARIDNKHESEIVADQALQFIEQSAAGSEPFMTTIWFATPHVPLIETPDTTYDGMGLSAKQRQYFESLTKMDEQVGRIRAKLSELGIAEDTLLVFTSDNGPQDGIGSDAYGSTGGLREDKAELFEGGIRVPMLLEWPGVIAADTSTNAMGTTSDLLPTLTDLWGIGMPDNRPLDGSSLRTVIEGTATQRGDNYRFFSEYKSQEMAMDNRFKLISTNNGSTYTLYDLIADPRESSPVATSSNLGSQSPEVQAKFSELQTALGAWKTETNNSGAGADFETRIVNSSLNATILADVETTMSLNQIGTDSFGAPVYEDKYQITLANNEFKADGKASVFLERQYATLTENLAIDSDGTPGSYDDDATLPTGLSIEAGTVLHSFLAHYNPLNDEALTVTLEFKGDILGVIADPSKLDNSDFLAFAEPVFDAGQNAKSPSRGMLFAEDADGGWTIGPDGRTITIHFQADGLSYDQLRILTKSSLQFQTLAILGDFNGDDLINLQDYEMFLTGLNADLSELTAQEAYQMGDMNGDLLNNFEDFLLFRDAYIDANGAGSFEVLATSVPEPFEATLLTIGGGFVSLSFPKANASRPASLTGATMLPQGASLNSKHD